MKDIERAKEIVMGVAWMIRETVLASSGRKPVADGDPVWDIPEAIANGKKTIVHTNDTKRPEAYFALDHGAVWKIPDLWEIGVAEIGARRNRASMLASGFENRGGVALDDDGITEDFAGYVLSREKADNDFREIHVSFNIETDTLFVDYVAGQILIERLLDDCVRGIRADDAIFYAAGRLCLPGSVITRANAMKKGLTDVAEVIRTLADSCNRIPLGEPRLANENLVRNDAALDDVSAVRWSWATCSASFTVGSARCFRLPGSWQTSCHMLSEDRDRVEEMIHDYRSAGGDVPDSGPLPEDFLAYAEKRLSRFPNIVEVGMSDGFPSIVEARLHRSGEPTYEITALMTDDPLEAARRAADMLLPESLAPRP